MAKLPYFPFYTGDWMKDPNLRSVSFSARGLWTDMLCLMHEGDRRGYLTLNGSPLSLQSLARMTGGSTEEVSQILTELINSGVCSCNDHGLIYSRRMVRDEKVRQARAEGGKKGGNPKLIQKSNLGVNLEVNLPPNLEVIQNPENEIEIKEVSNLGKLSLEGGVGGGENGNGKTRAYNPRPGFLKFKKIYPLFTNEFLTGQLWVQMVDSEETEREIFEALKWFIPFYRKNKGMPHSHTFLKDFRWRDPNPEFMQEQADEERDAEIIRRVEERKRASNRRS